MSSTYFRIHSSKEGKEVGGEGGLPPSLVLSDTI